MASHTVPHVSLKDFLKKKAFKTRKMNFLHAKSKTKIAYWNVCTLETLGDQNAQLLSTTKTMKEKNIELLALSKYRWTGCGITRIYFTTVLHCGSPSNDVRGVAIALSLHACSSWEAAGSVFHPISERIICICHKIHPPYVQLSPSMPPPTLSLDFVLVNSWFHSSVPDTRVFHSTYNVSDHEMVISIMSFKNNAKHHQSRVPLCQTTDLPPDSQIQFRSTLAEGLHCIGQSESPDVME